MDESIRFGRVAGVPVGASWSLLVVFWLITWHLASVVLPDADPGRSEATYWLGGAATAVVFLTCLLAHELAHAIVAQRRGVPVSGITLWMFGGVSKLEKDAPNARAELQIAIVGPLTSLGLAVTFGLVALAAPASGPFGDSLWWLARINVLLAAFNLVPAFPLDGGRVLRAALWERSGDRIAATRASAAAGRGFAIFLIAFGLLAVSAGQLVGGLWLMFIGWFLLSASAAETAQVEVGAVLAGVRVGDVMTPEPEVVVADATVAELLDRILATQHSSFPVVDAYGRAVGMITLDGVRSVPPARRATTRVGEVAAGREEVAWWSASAPLSDVLVDLSKASTRRAIVTEDAARIVGIVTPYDVTRAMEIARLQHAR